MLAFLNPLRELTFPALAFQMLLSCLCGAIIGLERSAKNRPAGFRTHILVCLGGAAAASVGTFLYVGLKLPADISRISGQVITGLGFIGAGTIVITKKQTIKGLTTAAGLWTTGIIGLAIGSGYLEVGILGTGLVILAETCLARVGGTIQHRPEYTIEVLYNEKTALDGVLRFCKDNHMAITNLQIHSMDAVPEADYAAEIRLRGDRTVHEMMTRIQVMPGVVSATDMDQ